MFKHTQFSSRLQAHRAPHLLLLVAPLATQLFDEPRGDQREGDCADGGPLPPVQLLVKECAPDERRQHSHKAKDDNEQPRAEVEDAEDSEKSVSEVRQCDG